MSVRVGGIYAELSLDDSRFTRSLDEAQRSMGTLRQAAQQAAQQVDQSFRNTGASIERGGLGARQAARHIDSVGDAAQTAARQVDRVGEAATEAARDVGRIEDAADEAATAARRIEIPSGLAAAAQRAADAVGSIGERASGAASTGSNMGDSFVGGFTGKLQGLAGKGGPIAAALVGVAGIGLAAGAVLAKAIGDGMQMEKDRDLIQARLGFNDATMKVIGAAAGAAFSNGWGESVQGNIDITSMLISSGMLSGEESAGAMQPLLEKVSAVNDLVGGEMVDTIKAASIMMKNGLAKDGDAALDLIFRGYQKVGLAGDDYIDSIKEYSNGWKNVGLSGEQALAILAQSTDRLGADSTDRAADAMRELGRRISEEGEDMVEGLDAIGFSGQEMYDKLKGGGEEGFQALDEIFDKLRGIEDQTERNTAIAALLGDTAGDFYDIFGNLDPSKAMIEFGNATEATDKAIGVMTDNGAASFEAARNSITASMDDVKLALGEAFGPHLAKLADWVSKHKPEIMAFFVGLANAGLATLDGMISFASGSLRAFADLQEGIGNTVGPAVEMLGKFSGQLGGILKHIPGLKDEGTALETAGKAAEVYGQGMNSVADKARGMADQLDKTKPTIQAIRDQVAEAGQAAVGAAEMTRLFGGAVDALPDGKSLVVEALTDDARARLTEFGFQVQNLDDGTVQISANTAEGQQLIDNFVLHNEGRKIQLSGSVQLPSTVTTPQGELGVIGMMNGFTNANGSIMSYANGKLPDQAIIQPGRGGGLVQWAEGETGDEAFIPLAPSKRRRSMAILAETARRMGARVLSDDPLVGGVLGIRDLLSFADGGILDSITAVQQEIAPGLSLTSGQRNEPGSYHNVGQAGDYSNGSGNTPEMLAWANYLADHHKSDLAELIYIDPKFQRCIKDGEFVPDSFYANAGDHTNHVHVAARRAITAAKVAAELTEQQKRADEIIAAGRERGISDKGIRQALGAAYAANGDDLTADEGHEQFDAGRFYDELARTDYENSGLDVGAAAIQGAQAEADTAAAVDLAGKAFDESEARAKAPASSGGSSVTGSPVYVTNWPSGLGGSSSSSSTPTDTSSSTTTGDPSILGDYTFRLFARGGVEDHSAHIAPGGDMRLFAEPETGGEAYIPLSPAKRGRSVGLLAQVADRFGLSLTPYAMGGFGGLGQDGDGGVHSGSWEVTRLGERDGVPLSSPKRDVPLAVWASSAYRAAAFAAGVAGTLASGWDADGNFQGFDTSANSLPAAWGDTVTEIQELLGRIAEAAEKGNPVSVDVAVDPSQRTAQLQIKQTGV